MSSNRNLRKAASVKNDEFYTLAEDVSAEMWNYLSNFRDKRVYLPCDDFRKSEFYRFFKAWYHLLGLKNLICSGIEGWVARYNGKSEAVFYGNGDFRSSGSEALLNESDIVVTNPPFSIFGEFVKFLVKHSVDFIILGHKCHVTEKSVFDLLRYGRVSLGYTVPQRFDSPEGIREMMGVCRWFTTFRGYHRELKLTRTFSESEYPRYMNFDAVNVDRVSEIPCDYKGVMGVPVTFMDYYDPERFEILGRTGDIGWARTCGFFTPPSEDKIRGYKKSDPNFRIQNTYIMIDDRLVCKYYRIFIRLKK